MPSKDVIVFYLKRHLRDIEDSIPVVTHELMAAAGVPYDRRQATLDMAAVKAAAAKAEIESFQEAIRIVQES